MQVEWKVFNDEANQQTVGLAHAVGSNTIVYIFIRSKPKWLVQNALAKPPLGRECSA